MANEPIGWHQRIRQINKSLLAENLFLKQIITYIQFVTAGNDDTSCHIVAAHSSLYADMGSGTGMCGPGMCQWTPDGTSTQLWQLVPVGSGVKNVPVGATTILVRPLPPLGQIN